MTPGQARALDALRAVEISGAGALEVLRSYEFISSLEVEISLDCRGLPSATSGIRVRSRERFTISIPAAYPFAHPTINTLHERWAGSPHVQWGTHLCLYQSVEAGWDPSDGMYGFLDRLIAWLQAAAEGELDPVGAPLHPPVAYTSSDRRMFIPRVNTPPISDAAWVGFASLHTDDPHRADINGWVEISDVDGADTQIAPTFLLPEPMPFEFPKRLISLLVALLDRGISPKLLFTAMSLAATINEGQEYVYVVVGTPMRRSEEGQPVQHLAVWRLGHEKTREFMATFRRDGDPAEVEAQRDAAWQRMLDWAVTAPVEWCPVSEARSEVVRPRDEGSEFARWAGKSVAIWGCGALGSHIAEHLVRAGVARLVLVDKGRVSPGILVRQNYEESDIGKSKVESLARRLRQIDPSILIEANDDDLVDVPNADWDRGVDVLFELTAAPAVTKRLERCLIEHPKANLTTVGMTIGHRAEHGLVVVAPPLSSGGPADCRRKAKIAASRSPLLRTYADEFWPVTPRTEVFQPEPGCSDPTFRGSGSEVAGLSLMMLGIASSIIVEPASVSMSAGFVSYPAGQSASTSNVMEFPNDLVLADNVGEYEIRIASTAVAQIRSWLRESRRLRPDCETGGILFGERDDAVGVIWVSDVLGPPPDSLVSPQGFFCGTTGVASAALAFRRRSRDASRPVGMWHTHPNSAPLPSDTDVDGMSQVLGDNDAPLPIQVLLIVGGADRAEDIAAYVYERKRAKQLADPPTVEAFPRVPARKEKIGLALSGGGFRAVAFHLGVMRALADLDLLDRVEVVSGVSGGSLITALWAYGPDDFHDFDQVVTDLLTAGLYKRLARVALLSRLTPQAICTALVAGSAAMASSLMARMFKRSNDKPTRMRAPIRRWRSRTNALEVVFAEVLGDVTMTMPTKDVHVILNACDLRTGTAFRFGSVESGSSRFGRLANPHIPVAQAVAASAAYPALLPALDMRLEFNTDDGTDTQRVILTDGGVFDNLGVTSLMPERHSRYSTNVHDVDYIISADAGRGRLDDDAFPFFWPSRMKRSFEAVFRKNQDWGKGELFQHVRRGTLKGIALPFLGQMDDALPIRPPDLIPRSSVIGYPTDFAPMAKRDLDRVAKRGEQLARVVVEYHCPEIA